MYGTGLDSGSEVLDSDSTHGTVPDSATKLQVQVYEDSSLCDLMPK